MTLTVEITHQDEYFNRTCQATIPEYWRADVVDGLPEEPHWSHTQYYGMGNSRDEALSDLIRGLKSRNMSGRLKVIG